MYMSNWLFLLKYDIKFLHCWAYVHQIEETYIIVFLHCWDYVDQIDETYFLLFLDCWAYVYQIDVNYMINCSYIVGHMYIKLIDELYRVAVTL